MPLDYSSLKGITPEYVKAEEKVFGNPIEPQSGTVDRSLGYLLGAVPSAIEGISSVAGNLFGFDGKIVDPANRITPAAKGNTSGKIIDFAGNLLPVAATFELGAGPIGALSKLTGLATKAPILASVAKQAAGFGAVGLAQSKETGLEEAGIGGAIGATHGLPILSRLPAAAALGLISKAIFDSRHPEADQGLIVGLGNAAASLLHTRVGGKAKPIIDTPMEFGPSTPPETGHFGGVRESFVNEQPEYKSTGLATIAKPEPEPVPKASVYPTLTSLQGMPEPVEPFTGEPIARVPAEPAAPPTIGETGIQAAFRQAAENKITENIKSQPVITEPIEQTVGYRPTGPTPEGIARPAPISPSEAAPSKAEPVIRPETTIERAQRLKAESDAHAPVPLKTIPPHQTQEFGSVGSVGAELPNPVIPPKFVDSLIPLATRASVGAAAGAVLAGPDATTSERIRAAALGAGILAAGPNIVGKLQELKPALKGKVATVAKDEQGSVPAGGGKKINADEVRPALKINGEEVVGQKGQTHKQVLDEYIAKNPDKAGEALVGFDASDNPNYFKQGAHVISRAELKEATGAAHTQDLQSLQNQSKPLQGNYQWKDNKGKTITAVYEKTNDKGWLVFREPQHKGIKLHLVDPKVEITPVKMNRYEEWVPRDSMKELSGSSESGSVLPDLNAYITRATVGGVLGGLIGGHNDTNGDTSGFVTGALFGALAAAAGPEIAMAGLRKLGKAELPKPTKGLNAMGDLKKVWEQKVEEQAGNVIHGSTRVADRFIAALDRNFNITLPEAVSRTMRVAEGTATQLLDTMDSAMQKMSFMYKVPEDVKATANKFLDGDITRTEFLQSLQTEQTKLYGQYVVAARESVDGLQRMIASGIGSDAKAKMISDSVGKYMTRSYKMFTRNNWTPEPATVDKLTALMQKDKVWESSSEGEIKDYLYSYIREVNAMKGMYSGSKSRAGQAIDQTVLKRRKDLPAEWREFLGEVTNPAERISQTLYRLRPMAVASKFMHDIATTMKEGDMPHYFRDRGELEAFKAKHLQSLQTATTPEAKQAISLQLAKLDNFQPVESLPKYGELRGGLVSRNVWNVLSTYDSMTSLGSHPWMRSVSGLNVAAKLSNTALNPISFVRNVYQVPMMMALGRASMNDVYEGLKILHDPAHPLRAEVIKQGIGSVDQLKQEIFRDFEAATEGKFNAGNMDSSNLSLGGIDVDVARKGFGKVSNKYLEVYRSPDNAVRIGTYLSAKRRIAEAIGKGLDDLEVIQKATDFTNRYTMDYGAVAPIIKNVRQIPGINLYISYISEMTRISKNVVMDLIHGGDGLTAHDRLYASLPIAFLGALPEVLNSLAESSLSPSDKSDWEKAKQLMPDYARTRYRANIKREADGNFTYTDFTPLIPTDFIHQSAKALAHGDLEALAAVNPVFGLSNSPALNILVEQTTGRDVHTQRNFRGFSDRVASVAKEFLPPWVGAGREAQKFEQAYTPTDEGTLGLTNLKTGQRLTPADFWLPYATALRSGGYNLSVLQQKYTAEVKRDIADNTAYLNDILKSDAAPEIKTREIEKFRRVHEELIEAWKEKLGINESDKLPLPNGG